MTAPAPFQMSQGFVVLPPKSGNAYPIPVDEWNVLKGKCEEMTNEPWFFHSLGFLLLGACGTTLTSILLGTYPAPPQSYMAWSMVFVTGVCGVLCLYFAYKERGVQRTRATDIVTQMEIIERRFERNVE